MNDQALRQMRGVALCPLTIGDLVLGSYEDMGALPRGNAWATLLVPFAGTPLLGTGAALAAIPVDALLVAFRKDRLNAEVSRRLGDGRRLASLADRIALSGADGMLERAIEDLWHGGAGGLAREAGFYRALAQRMVERDDRDTIMLRMRAVSEAIRIVRAQHQQPFDVERLASMVGVTADTLRKGFRTCLGVTVNAFINSVRLDWAFHRLSDLRECRSLAEVAAAAGFGGGQSFSRHYVRRFAETPTQTRARAARIMR